MQRNRLNSGQQTSECGLVPIGHLRSRHRRQFIVDAWRNMSLACRHNGGELNVSD
jgi:hypothetical protein